MYANVVWARVFKFVMICAYLAEALLKGFKQTWGARNALFKWDRMKITWNWKRQCS
jgi:hypothetical protein